MNNNRDLFKYKPDSNFPKDDITSNLFKIKTEYTAEKACKQTKNMSFGTNNPIIVDDDVYEEAHSLVKSWMTNKKVYGDMNDMNGFMRLSNEEEAEIKCRLPTKFEIHREWEHLMGGIDDKINIKMNLENLDGNSGKTELDKVMNHLQATTFVDKRKLRYVDKPREIDHLNRIECRHEEVRKRKAQREILEEQQRQSKLAEKEARSEALKQQKEAKRLRDLKLKKEEELIQMEMNRVRAELHKQRELESIERKKMKETQKLLHEHQNQSKLKEQLDQEQKQLTSKLEANHADRVLMVDNLIEQRISNRNKQIKSKYFTVWRYFVELSNRKMLRAANVYRVTLLRRLFCYWLHNSRQMKLQRQLQLDHRNILLMKRKEERSVDFYQKKLLKKSIIEWSLFVIDVKETRWCNRLEEMRKKKMAEYIESLTNKVQENQRQIELLSNQQSSNLLPKEIQSAKYEQSEFPITLQQKPPISSQPRPASHRINSPNELPTEAWKITKKHVYLPIEKIVGQSKHNSLSSTNSRQNSSHSIKSLNSPKKVDNYSSRNAAQKEIIEVQKQKIREQQELIEQLKLQENLQKINKFDLPQSREIPEENIIEETNDECQVKAADSSRKGSIEHLIPVLTNKSKLVLKMEERAKERDKIKGERLQRKQQLELEKQKMLEEQIAEQERQDAEQKLEREKILKEKRQKEKLKQEQLAIKQRVLEEKNAKADEFYRRLLMKRYGVGRWKILIASTRNNWKKAQLHYSIKMERLVFTKWLEDFRQDKAAENHLVFQFYNKIMMRKCFHHIKIYKHRMVLLSMKAEDHHQLSLKTRIFQQWRLYNHRQQIRSEKLEIEAAHIYNKNLLKHCLELWKEVPMAARQEKEREKRLRAMCDKVSSLIPDFNPTKLLSND